MAIKALIEICILNEDGLYELLSVKMTTFDDIENEEADRLFINKR